MKNMQDSCIGTHMAVWFAAFLPFTYIWHFSPCYLSPTPYPLLSLTYFHPTDPRVWCSPPCVHLFKPSNVYWWVFSLFNTRLWVRTCGVWFSVLVSSPIGSWHSLSYAGSITPVFQEQHLEISLCRCSHHLLLYQRNLLLPFSYNSCDWIENSLIPRNSPQFTLITSAKPPFPYKAKFPDSRD